MEVQRIWKIIIIVIYIILIIIFFRLEKNKFFVRDDEFFENNNLEYSADDSFVNFCANSQTLSDEDLKEKFIKAEFQSRFSNESNFRIVRFEPICKTLETKKTVEYVEDDFLYIFVSKT